MTIKELKKARTEWIKYLIEDEKSQNTIRQYERALDVFMDYLDENKIKEIDKMTVISYKSEMLEELKQNQLTGAKPVDGKRPLSKLSTVNLRLRALNALFKFAGAADMAVKLEKNETKNVTDDVLNEKEIARILDFCDREQNTRMRLIIETLLGTGIRISELEAVTVESLKKRITTVTNKSKTRYIFIPKNLAKKLRQYCKDQDIKSGIIFHSRDGSKMLDQGLIRNEMKRIAGKARGISLKKVHPHVFRHCFAKRYASMPNTNAYVLPMLLGHSDSATSVTSLYTKPSTKELLKAVDDIEAYYAPKKQTKKKRKKANE